MTITLKRLGDIATYVNGYAFKPTDWKNKGLPIIRIQNLTNPDSPFNYYQGEIDDKYIVNKGDILISWSASLGVFEWLGEKAVLNQHIFKVIFDKEDIDKSYFKYIVQRSLERALKYLHGSTMKHITKKYFDNILVPIPDLVTQKKIAKVLDKAQELIDKRKAQIAALDQLAQSVFLEMFGDPLLNPKGWKKESFSYFAKIDTVMIKDFTEYGELIHVGIENIEKDSGRIVNCRTVAEDKIVSGKYLFNEKHIIYSKIRPYLNKVATPNFKGVCSADAYPILVDETKASRHFFAFLLRSKAFLNHVNQHSDRTNIPKVNKNQLFSFEGICPPLELQNKFSKVVEKIEEQRELLIQGLHELEKNFNSLMQRAFKVELFND